jgi:hypothetical protein
VSSDKILIQVGLNICFDRGKIDLIERNAYQIRFFQQDLRVGMIMRTNNSFETIITNKSIGVEIETFKETNSKGEIEVYEKSKLKKLISHTKELIND